MRGGFLFTENEAQEEALSRFGTFTCMRDYGVWGMHQIALLVQDGSNISEAGTLSDSRMRVTGQRGLRYTRGVEFVPPVGVIELRDALPARLRVGLERHAHSEGKLAEHTWHATIDALSRLRPESATALRELIAPRAFDTPARRTAAFDKDATSLAAEIFDVSQSDRLFLRSAAPSPTGSFVDTVVRGRAREDPMVAYDAQRVPGMDAELYPNGVARFTRGGELLLVCNVNKMPLETTLGADLIYYNEPLEAFVLVQYKLLRPEGRQAGERYRPDAQLREELTRMRRIPIGEFGGGSPRNWRLGPGLSFVKLCEPPIATRPPEQLLRGLYVPLGYLDAVTASPDLGKGARGAEVLSRETLGRSLGNELFVGLVRGGWIGSYSATSTDLRTVVRAQYEAGHSVTVAAKTTIAAWEQSTRDTRQA